MSDFWKALKRPGTLLRIAIAIGCGFGIYYAIDAWIGGATSIVVDIGTRPIELLDPRWLLLVCVIPYFFLLRIVSLTDLSVTQQVFQSGLRSLVVAGLAIALARPSWVTRDSKVSTVVLVDVSDSVSDKQLDAARAYLADLSKAKGEEGNIQVISFAEK